MLTKKTGAPEQAPEYRPRKMLLIEPVGMGAVLWARRWAKHQVLWLEREGDMRRARTAAGLDPSFGLESPFRAPHHTVSLRGLVGSIERGWYYRPGELHLAHGGVLFLDGFQEFRIEAREAIRMVWERKRLELHTGTGGLGALTIPIECSMVIYSTPCPCGFKGHAKETCRCSEAQIAAHLRPLDALTWDAERVTIDERERRELRAELPEDAAQSLAKGLEAYLTGGRKLSRHEARESWKTLVASFGHAYGGRELERVIRAAIELGGLEGYVYDLDALIADALADSAHALT